MRLPPGRASAQQTSAAAVAVTGSPKIRLDALDTLRGLCALMVVLFHANFSGFLIDQPIIRHSYLFVDFFFVLSGFIMYYNYASLPNLGAFRKFIAMRFFRLYPLHFAMLMAFLVVEVVYSLGRPLRGAAAGTAAGSAGYVDILLNLFLLNGFPIRPPSFNTPSWSISTEFWTYVLFGGLILGFKNVRKSTMAAIFAGVCVCALVTIDLRYGEWRGFILLLFPRCVFGFFLGAVLGIFVQPSCMAHVVGGARIGAACQCLALVAAVVAVTLVGFSALDILLPVLFAAVIATFVAWPHTWLTQLLLIRPLLWLGRHSYSIYMVHWLVLTQIGEVLRVIFHVPVVNDRFAVAPVLGFAVTLVSIAIILMLASQTYLFIEEPGRLFGRRLLKRGRGMRTLDAAVTPAQAPRE